VRTISIVNQKGGCGKTTTAINLAVAFAQCRERVLLVDLDPQAHVTSGLGHDPDSFKSTIYDALLKDDCLDPDIVIRTDVAGLDLIPCNVLLANAEVQLTRTAGTERRLGRCLDGLGDRYDVCVIDCPPSLGILTANALAAGSDVIVPVSVHYRALDGVHRLVGTIQLMRGCGQASAVRVHLLLTFVEGHGSLARRLRQELRDRFGGMVLNAVIHRSVKLAEAPGAGMSVLSYAPQSQGAADYRTLAREVLAGRRREERQPIAPVRRRAPGRLDGILGRLRTLSRGRADRLSKLGAFDTT
jgi:chromosome partitioning protein